MFKLKLLKLFPDYLEELCVDNPKTEFWLYDAPQKSAVALMPSKGPYRPYLDCTVVLKAPGEHGMLITVSMVELMDIHYKDSLSILINNNTIKKWSGDKINYNQNYFMSINSVKTSSLEIAFKSFNANFVYNGFKLYITLFRGK